MKYATLSLMYLIGLNEINETYISLILKTKNASQVGDFQLISLCNVIYKIISKVLVNRLKSILPNIIFPNQSDFIPNRLISDNVLGAFETLHTLSNRNLRRERYKALKLDMSKAYNRVKWSFLEAVMTKMGFDSKWINLIMSCINSISSSLLVNGVPQ